MQVVSTVATLSKTSTSLSTDAKSKMLNVGKAGISAAKLSPKPLTPEGGSRLLAVLAAGNGVSAACKLPNGCKQTTAARASRHLLSEEVCATCSEQWPGSMPCMHSKSDFTASQLPHPHVLSHAAFCSDIKSAGTNNICCLLPCLMQAAGQARSLQQSTNTTTPSFVPAYMADATAIADLLLQSTTPATQWASSGDNGVYVGVANQLGRNYKGLQSAVAVGPVSAAGGSQADASVKDNVVISLSDNLVGTCKDETGADITDGSCLVPLTAVYVTDPAGALDQKGFLTEVVPDGFKAVSGVVTLQAGKVAKGALPCATAGCTASLRFPVMESADVSKLYQCFQVVDGKVYLSTDAVAGTASRDIVTAAGEVPTFTCAVKQAGSYLVGKYPDPKYQQAGAAEQYANIAVVSVLKHWP